MELDHEEYLRFVRERLEKSDYRAEEKLTRIDELSDIVFHARKNLPSKKNESKQ